MSARGRRSAARSLAPVLLVAVLVAAVTVAAAALGLREPEVIPMDEAVGREVRVRGVVNRYGNEPHTWLGLLVDPDEPPEVEPGSGRLASLPRETVFELVADEAAMPGLAALAGRKVVVTGELVAWPEDRLVRPRIAVAEYAPAR